MSDTAAGVLQLVVLLVLLAAAWRPVGDWMARVYTDERHWRVERVVYRIGRVDPDADQRASTYALAVLAFSLLGVLLVYLVQRVQGWLPLATTAGGQDKGAVDPGVAFNTAISFVTNTNWQSYVPETTMSHVSNAVALTVQNFLSAAVGMAVAVALVRGLIRSRSGRIGNAWVDITRGVVRILAPAAVVLAVVLVAGGVVMSLRSGVALTGPDGAATVAAIGPVASQEAIKMLGTNGGGILNANSAHPFENPTGWTNLLEIFAMLVIPVSFTRTFGRLVGGRGSGAEPDRSGMRQGVALLAVMTTLWGAVLAIVWVAEAHAPGTTGAAMEGKEARFGIPSSALFATSTTGTSTGAVNSLHDSFTAFGGGGALTHMLFGELSPGGVGSGLYSILVVAIIAVFLAGLMVGRTPEFLGKSVGRREITCAAVVVLVMPALVLVGTGTAVVLPGTSGALTNSGPHGLSEVLYAFASAANNNGSAFGGLTVTSAFFQVSLALAMLFGRFIPILAVLALAGLLSAQPRREPTAGTLRTDTPLFSGLVTATVVLVSAITFLPALALSPIAEGLMNGALS